ncbi:hypothetical protein chiPu_0015949 [Chiloscyllium punctatum]|uniref:Uncharacterized protein n=1 Tax=Chiloscyllium punctatum TaxID=137246 RepID=A0A401T492_CHIPU|nr:hypothetical protein [Chiloscyllium punctatum]
MAKLVSRCLVLPSRVALAAAAAAYWIAVYTLTTLAGGLFLLRMAWVVIRRRGRAFEWRRRERPPACLSDPSLGIHCFVRVKVSSAAAAAVGSRAAFETRFSYSTGPFLDVRVHMIRVAFWDL